MRRPRCWASPSRRPRSSSPGPCGAVRPSRLFLCVRYAQSGSEPLERQPSQREVDRDLVGQRQCQAEVLLAEATRVHEPVVEEVARLKVFRVLAEHDGTGATGQLVGVAHYVSEVLQVQTGGL